jgi:hypothetical protein
MKRATPTGYLTNPKRELPTEFLKFLAKTEEENEAQHVLFRKQTMKKEVRTNIAKFSQGMLKLKMFILNLWPKYITEPIKSRRDLKKQTAQRNAVIKDFEQRYGVSHKATLRAMKIGVDQEQTREKYLNEQLHNHLKTMDYSKAPCFYEPDICEIHNENPDRLDHPPLKEVLRNFGQIDKEVFSGVNTKKNKAKADYLWMTRT